MLLSAKVHEKFSLRTKALFSAQKMYSVKGERSASICLLPFYFELNVYVSLNLYIEALMLNMLVLGGEALGR